MTPPNEPLAEAVAAVDADAGLSCSELARALGEPIAGTAGWASTWLLIENREPWPSHAVRDMLPEHLRQGINAKGWNAQLVREFDDRRTEGPRRVWVVDVAARQWWQWAAADSAAQESLIGELLAGSPPAAHISSTQPFLLVCANGKRDACCAVHGRALLSELVADRASDDLIALESTHLGGHRFSAVVAALPASYVYRCDGADHARRILGDAAAGTVTSVGLRGHTARQSPEQVVELALRERLDIWAVDAQWSAETAISETGAQVRGTFASRPFSAELRRRQGRARPESCTGESKQLHWWEITELS